MSEMKKSYVGVSGVVSPEMQATLEGLAMKTELFSKNRFLALGVKATHKTQYDDDENKYGKEWYPVGEEGFNGALRHDYPSHFTKAVAQTYLEITKVGDEEYRKEFVKQIHERGQPWLQGIQFDMLPWHDNDDMLGFLEYVKASTGLELFLQAHGGAMTELQPKGIIQRLGAYAQFVDYLLFDASHGTGKRLDVDALEPFIAEAYSGLDTSQTGIAIAGGLNGDVIREELPELIAAYPNLSWDAEGQLHPYNEAGKRPLDMTITEDYLQASASLLR